MDRKENLANLSSPAIIERELVQDDSQLVETVSGESNRLAALPKHAWRIAKAVRQDLKESESLKDRVSALGAVAIGTGSVIFVSTPFRNVAETMVQTRVDSAADVIVGACAGLTMHLLAYKGCASAMQMAFERAPQGIEELSKIMPGEDESSTPEPLDFPTEVNGRGKRLKDWFRLNSEQVVAMEVPGGLQYKVVAAAAQGLSPREQRRHANRFVIAGGIGAGVNAFAFNCVVPEIPKYGPSIIQFAHSPEGALAVSLGWVGSLVCARVGFRGLRHLRGGDKEPQIELTQVLEPVPETA